MKKLNQKEIFEKAKSFFKENPKKNKVVITEDGNCFTGGTALNYAQAHAKQWDLEKFEYSRSRVELIETTKAKVEKEAAAKAKAEKEAELKNKKTDK